MKTEFSRESLVVKLKINKSIKFIFDNCSQVGQKTIEEETLETVNKCVLTTTDTNKSLLNSK